eukprot:9679461-Ditylum_brightwellii.AAC.1
MTRIRHGISLQCCSLSSNSSTTTLRLNSGMPMILIKHRASLLAQIYPHEHKNLAVYCPHVQRNTYLETQWRLKSTARYYEFKTNQIILAHLQRHRIFMNPTEVKQIEAIVAGFFVLSHIKFRSRRDAAADITTCALIDGFSLHAYMCCHMQQRHMKAIAVSCGKSIVGDVKSKLY